MVGEKFHEYLRNRGANAATLRHVEAIMSKVAAAGDLAKRAAGDNSFTAKHKSDELDLHIRHAFDHLGDAARLAGELRDRHDDDADDTGKIAPVGMGADDLRKVAPSETRFGRFTLRPGVPDRPVVPPLGKRDPQRGPAGAIADARARADHLAALAKAAPKAVSPSEVVQARRDADALEASRAVPRVAIAAMTSASESRLPALHAELQAAIDVADRERASAVRRELAAEEWRVAYALGKRRMVVNPGGGDLKV
jgi:hypothetical protein